jgi:hypothetical protein
VLLAAVYMLRTIAIQLILAIVLAMAAEPLVRFFEWRGTLAAAPWGSALRLSRSCCLCSRCEAARTHPLLRFGSEEDARAGGQCLAVGSSGSKSSAAALSRTRAFSSNADAPRSLSRASAFSG